MKCVDPATMSTSERIGELGELLAAGVQRFLARQGKAIPAAEVEQDHLDVQGQVEAPCPAHSTEGTK